MNKWHTGSGYEISMKGIEEELKTHISNNGDVFIGCDSFLKADKCIFASVICLHGADNQSGGRYFWIRERYKAEKYHNLQYQVDLIDQIPENGEKPLMALRIIQKCIFVISE